MSDRFGLVLYNFGIDGGLTQLQTTEGLEEYYDKYAHYFQANEERGEMLNYIKYTPNPSGVGFTAWRT